MEGASIDLSPQLTLTYRGNINHYKSVHHPPSALFMGIMTTLVAFFKKISKLFFRMSVQVYFLLGQIEGERKTFLEMVQEGEPHCEITLKSTWLL